jgi:hypothetical protein
MGAVRRSAVAATAAATITALGVGAPAVGAAPPQTETITVKDSETFIDVVPFCGEDGDPYEITIDYILVEHSTVGDSHAHFTFTQTGTFVAVPLDPSLPEASGRFTQWGGFNETTGGAVNGTFTFSVRGSNTDGERINFHLVDHFNETPSGGSFFFTHCHD